MLQGYFAHKKLLPPRTVYQGPYGGPRGVEVSYERGTPIGDKYVSSLSLALAHTLARSCTYRQEHFLRTALLFRSSSGSGSRSVGRGPAPPSCKQFIVHYLFFAVYDLLFIIHSSLFFVFCLLFIVYCLLFRVYCLLFRLSA